MFRKFLNSLILFPRRGRLPLLLLLSAWGGLPPLCAAESGVYYWHRERNERSERVLAACADWKLYILRGEFRKGAPAILLRLPAVCAVPVFRLDALVWNDEKFVEKFASILRSETAPEVQLDCDVPESRLLQYGSFLERLRRLVPGKRFSATLLPCHLRHPAALKALFCHLAFYVLQLHALEPPGDLPGKYLLFDPDAADRAVAAAVDLRKEFKMALPTYAYRLHYEARTGRFRRLSAENAPPEGRGEEVRFAVPDWEKLLQFRKKYAAIPVVWFRLAMENDRLCLELENLRRLDAGLPPRVVIECFSRRIGVRTELFWRNHGVLGEQEFQQFLGGGTGEAFFFHGVHPVIPVVPGCVPRMICGPIPGPGETLKIGEINQWIPPESKSCW